MGLVLTWPVGRDADGRPAHRAAPAGPVFSYLLGSVVGGTSTGLAIGALAGAVDRVPAGEHMRLLAAAALLALAVVLELRGRVAPLPQRRAQVPRGWLSWPSRSRTALAFGLLIGSGVATYLKHATAYAIAAMALVAPSFWAAVLIGTVYGAARGGTLLVTWIGDRFIGRRPPAAPVEERDPPLNVALATLASLSFAVAALPIT